MAGTLKVKVGGVYVPVPQGPKGDTGDTGLTGPQGPTGPQGAQGDGNVSRVVHNGTAYPSRPTGTAYVEWVGPTDPAAQSGLSVLTSDSWYPTT